VTRFLKQLHKWVGLLIGIQILLWMVSGLAISLLDLYATSLGLGCCWGGYFYSAINFHRLLFEDLGLPDHHKAYGAVMVGYPKFRYRRIPLRNPPRVSWK